MNIRRIESDQHRVEGKSPHRFHQDGRIVMAGESQKSDASFLPGPDEGFERSSFGKDAVQVIPGAEIMQLP